MRRYENNLGPRSAPAWAHGHPVFTAGERLRSKRRLDREYRWYRSHLGSRSFVMIRTGRWSVEP